ncbi:hypothetical protein Tco_1305755 [Tanacetum coccineum]
MSPGKSPSPVLIFLVVTPHDNLEKHLGLFTFITLKAWFECAGAQRFVNECDDALGRPSAEETSKWLLEIVHQTRIQSTNLLPCRRETIPKTTSQQGWLSSKYTCMLTLFIKLSKNMYFPFNINNETVHDVSADDRGIGY